MLPLEDLVLAGWNLVSVPIGAALGGGWTSSGSAPLLGLLELAATGGAIVALATRDTETAAIEDRSFRAWALAGPLMGAVVLVGGNASDRLGMNVGGFLGIAAFIAVVAAFALGSRLPVIEPTVRRLLVAPFVFVTAAFFTDFVASLLDGLDLGELARALFDGRAAASELAGVAGLVAFFVIAGSAMFYAMLVIAPRELVSGERRPHVWLLRFVVFIASAVVGAGGYVLL